MSNETDFPDLPERLTEKDLDHKKLAEHPQVNMIKEKMLLCKHFSSMYLLFAVLFIIIGVINFILGMPLHGLVSLFCAYGSTYTADHYNYRGLYLFRWLVTDSGAYIKRGK